MVTGNRSVVVGMGWRQVWLAKGAQRDSGWGKCVLYLCGSFTHVWSAKPHWIKYCKYVQLNSLFYINCISVKLFRNNFRREGLTPAWEGAVFSVCQGGIQSCDVLFPELLCLQSQIQVCIQALRLGHGYVLSGTVPCPSVFSSVDVHTLHQLECI